jgi:excisionase family DNA binding protein
MATTKKKPKKRTAPEMNGPLSPPAVASEVFTLAETAAYLRLKEDDVKRLAEVQGIPGRFVGNEWRFLKSAIQEWLSMPRPNGANEGIWAQAGSWKDDPYLNEMLEDIYRKRGRPMARKE